MKRRFRDDLVAALLACTFILSFLSAASAFHALGVLQGIAPGAAVSTELIALETVICVVADWKPASTFILRPDQARQMVALLPAVRRWLAGDRSRKAELDDWLASLTPGQRQNIAEASIGPSRAGDNAAALLGRFERAVRSHCLTQPFVPPIPR